MWRKRASGRQAYMRTCVCVCLCACLPLCARSCLKESVSACFVVVGSLVGFRLKKFDVLFERLLFVCLFFSHSAYPKEKERERENRERTERKRERKRER